MGDETQPNGSGNDPKGNGTPGATDELSEAQMNAVNRAITGRLDQFGKKQSKEFGELLATHSKGLTEAFSEQLGNALKEFKPAPASDDKGKGKDGKDKGGGEEDPKFRELQTQLEASNKKTAELAAKYEKAEQEKQAQRAKARADKLRQRTLEELQKQGLDLPRAKFALAHLVDASGLVRYADDEGDDIVFGDDGDKLDTGLKAFFKTTDGKVLLPPKGARGSGDGGGNNQRTGGAQQGDAPDWANIGARLLGGGG